MTTEEKQASVEIENSILGKAKIYGTDNVNTIFTVFGFVLLVFICYNLWIHAADAKDSIKQVAAELKEANREVAQQLKESNKELSEVMKEMARATREQNCLLSLPQDRRQDNAETCKRISR